MFFAQDQGPDLRVRGSGAFIFRAREAQSRRARVAEALHAGGPQMWAHDLELEVLRCPVKRPLRWKRRLGEQARELGRELGGELPSRPRQRLRGERGGKLGGDGSDAFGKLQSCTKLMAPAWLVPVESEPFSAA